MRTATKPPVSKPKGFRIHSGWTPTRVIKEMQRASSANASYWSQVKRPLPCLVFVLPLLLAYEMGLLLIAGDSADQVRTGADFWIRHFLSGVGLKDRWLPPLAIVLGLLAWQVADPRQWRFSPNYLLGMALESLLFAVALVAASKLVDLGFQRLDDWQSRVLDTGSVSPGAFGSLLGYVGAGVYEEAIFRLALIPLLLAVQKTLHTPKLLMGTITITGSALLFAIAHHVGQPGEAFSWFVFVFRWFAGVYFAWVFIARGFGVAVGAHVLYDILVGWLGLHF